MAPEKLLKHTLDGGVSEPEGIVRSVLWPAFDFFVQIGKTILIDCGMTLYPALGSRRRTNF
jgi:hypothetical protein